MYDVIIIGAGPAGLSAALILGRCRRRILVCDSGEYRNEASQALHGFLTRDGIHPAELRRLAREDLHPYGAEFLSARVSAARRVDDCFEVAFDDGARQCSRRLLLATGVVDHLPEIEGTAEFYGRGIFHCPYCDGWEVRDQPLAVYGRGKNGAGLAVALKTWSAAVVLCTDGHSLLRPPEAQDLTRAGIPVRKEHIARFEGGERLERIVFTTGDSLPCRAVFLSTGQHQRSPLPVSLGCEFNRKGTVRTNRLQGCNVPGLYVAGDASRDVQLAIVAAAEGAKAGFAINSDLQNEERR
jgi:thioredoxin reductase